MDKIMDIIIHDKDVKRKIEILQILNKRQTFVSSCEISDQLKCSSRTILNDISQLKKDIPNNWDIISIKSKGHRLVRPISESINCIIATYIKESLVYKVLMGIFNNKHYSLEKWSQKLYVNKITLKNILKKLNETLNQVNLELKFRVIRLEGEERDIRCLYIAFFCFIQKYIKQIDIHCPLKKRIRFILEFYEIEMDLNLLTSIIDVCTKRIFDKKYVESGMEMKIGYESNQLECYNMINSILEECYRLKIPENEKNVLNLCYFLASKNTREVKNQDINYYHDLYKKNYEKFRVLLNTLAIENETSAMVREGLVSDIGSTLYKIQLMNDYDIALQYFFSTPNNLSCELQEIYEKNYAIISLWNTVYNNDQFTRHQIHFIISSSTFLFYSRQNKRNVLLLFSGTTVEEKLVYSKLKKELGNYANIYSIWSTTKQYDFIIANYHVVNCEVPAIYISQNCNRKEIDNIKKIMNKKTDKINIMT
ncbi:helix-turn-helix domain-containing protein [Bacillus mycoides]|uniref:helix-turn-helix domain-containing protein n=1 Tax=Bacillus mycoides TaxID=1405 RepID=UPI003D645AA2